jgi:alanyl-tRNA synthetase
MQYVKNEDGTYSEAKQKNVDTGMGLERTTAVLNGKENVFETDLFLPIIQKIEELSGKKYNDYQKEFRIITDHIKASVLLAAEGIVPSNVEQGYILRRLLRRAIRHGKTLQMPEDFLTVLIKSVVEIYKDIYSVLEEKEELVVSVVRQEEEKFELTLEKGLKEFEKGESAFNLYQSYGFPIEMTQELAKEKGKEIDMDEFKKELEKHQDLSRTASAGMFKGGLADNSEATTKLHTAAHLMLAGLRKVLGDDVYQKGSNITAERLRFDFSHKEKMSSGQLVLVENFVNDIIKKDLPVTCEEMTLDKARELNAMGVFESKYGEKVKVYTVGEGDQVVSREICGGPHVERTGILGHFKIQKEESSSSGVRRIKAIIE